MPVNVVKSAHPFGDPGTAATLPFSVTANGVGKLSAQVPAAPGELPSCELGKSSETREARTEKWKAMAITRKERNRIADNDRRRRTTGLQSSRSTRWKMSDQFRGPMRDSGEESIHSYH